MYFFYTMYIWLMMQRIGELLFAKRNEKLLLQKGAFEIGGEHYKWIVGLHVSFFLSLLTEVVISSYSLSNYWPLWFSLFLLLQIGRIWTIYSLGIHWNTKVIILPNEKPIKKGPYRYMKHPNYLIVALELIVIPCLFEAYATMIVFSLMNMILMMIRIPLEEQGLNRWMEYGQHFSTQMRFFPKWNRK
jgi:methyltransferase